MNKTNIEWTDYTWNPVTGCKHGCHYCYAKKIAMRFTGHFEPTFHPERLDDFSPFMRIKKGSKIFVCSMADLFGDWVPKEWIEEIIKITKVYAGFTFQFLTKNPKRYLEFDFPDNCWLGTTIESAEHGNRMKPFADIKNYKFVSIEPLLGEFAGMNFDRFDLVIVGAMTGPKAIPPKKDWIDSVKHRNIFYKDNIKKYL